MTLYIALCHYPVLDRAGSVISTAVTNLDVHDIARTARTYDLAGYFVVSPIEAQQKLVNRILSHWREGSGKARVPERAEALAICEACDSIEVALAEIEERTGQRPLVVGTSARESRATTPYAEAREALAERPAVLLFGTGHGLTPQVVDSADMLLPAIRGEASYNHLSVRAAVAITLDRLIDRPPDA